MSAFAIWFFAAHGWLYYFGDAEAHLNHARDLVDTITPGWEQLGTPWLPLPHFLMAPLAANDALWHNGLAGSIPSGICFTFAAWLLFLAVEECFTNMWAAWTALLTFLFNPNGLYLQSSAMTEPYFALAVCGLLYFTVRHRRTQALTDAAFAGVFALAGTLTRYDGWFLLPFCALSLLLTSRRRWLATLVFCAIAALGPLAWVYYNWWLSGNWLEFFNGASSAKAIQGNATYPGFHDWRLAWIYVTTAIRLVLGRPLCWLIAIGLIAALAKRQWWPVLLLLLPAAFYIWSMHSSGNPIFVPELYPHSWYNTRYGLCALPLAAFCAAAMVAMVPRRAGLAVGCVTIALAIFPWVVNVSPENWITWKESERNSISRRDWTYQASDYLRYKVHRGEHVAAEFNDTIGIFRYAGIDLKQVFHQGNGLQWQAAVQRPDLFLNSTWIVCQRHASSELSRAAQRADAYVLVKSIAVPDADPLDIYHHANPFYQSPRREE